MRARLLELSRRLLDEVTRLLPQTCLDGSRNVWIIKPDQASKGRGILLVSGASGLRQAGQLRRRQEIPLIETSQRIQRLRWIADLTKHPHTGIALRGALLGHFAWDSYPPIDEDGYLSPHAMPWLKTIVADLTGPPQRPA